MKKQDSKSNTPKKEYTPQEIEEMKMEYSRVTLPQGETPGSLITRVRGYLLQHPDELLCEPDIVTLAEMLYSQLDARSRRPRREKCPFAEFSDSCMTLR